jgi:hypothetical protein
MFSLDAGIQIPGLTRKQQVRGLHARGFQPAPQHSLIPLLLVALHPVAICDCLAESLLRWLRRPSD